MQENYFNEQTLSDNQEKFSHDHPLGIFKLYTGLNPEIVTQIITPRQIVYSREAL